MNVVIVGVDEYGKHVYDSIIQQRKDYTVVGFMEWEFRKTIDEFCNRPVMTLEQVVEMYPHEVQKVILAITTNRYLSHAIQSLSETKINEVYIVPLYTLEKKKAIFGQELSETECVQKLDLSKPNLAHLETHIVDYCNLNCKACNNFSPLFMNNETAHLENFIRDLTIIKHKFDMICRLFLLGGEPLLAQDKMVSFLQNARDICPKTEIRVITNGLLLTKLEEKTLNCLRDTDTLLQISLYPPVAAEKEKLIKFLKDNNIKYIISNEVTHFVKRLLPKPISNPYISEKNCGSAGCTYFRDGKVSKCPDSILVEAFDKKFGTNYHTKEFIDLSDNIDGFELQKKINSPIDMCKFCKEQAEIVPWEVTRKVVMKEDWIVNDVNNEDIDLYKHNFELQEECDFQKKRNIVIEERNRVLEERNIVVEERNRVLEERNAAVEERNRVLEERNVAVEERNRVLEERNTAVEERCKDVEAYNTKMEQHIINLGNRIEEVSYYNSQLVEERQKLKVDLENIENTIAWKISRTLSFNWVREFISIMKKNIKKVIFICFALGLIITSIYMQFVNFNKKNVIFSYSQKVIYSNAGSLGEIVLLLDNERMSSLETVDNYFLSYHLLEKDGTLYEYDGLRSELSIPPKTKKEVTLCFEAPQIRGEYILQVDIVQEGVQWLSEEGNETLDIVLQVN